MNLALRSKTGNAISHDISGAIIEEESRNEESSNENDLSHQ
jgi:hypothetical protein